MPYKDKPHFRARFRRPVVLLPLLLIIAVGTLLALELSGRTHIIRKEKAVSSTIPAQTPTAPEPATPPADESSQSTPATDSSAPPTSEPDTKETIGSTAPPSDTAPTAPYGSFVSNHTPGKDGAPTAVQSTCQTTPGAMCTITFTNGAGVVKTLAAQKADQKGTASWTWDVRTSGFVSGKWKIEAKATLNGQSATTADPIAFEVSL